MGFLLTGGGKATFERLLDAATSQMLLEPNWVTNLEICDSIRQQDVIPKFALSSIRKRMADPNPHVSKFALIVLETCVKNCGQPFHEEITNADFLDEMRKLVETGSAPVKEQALTMIQAWNHAFRNKTQFQPIQAIYNLLRMQGHKFPPLKESDAMFSADAAPAWKDGDVCHLCRVKFGTFTRQHHCRACGEPFCSKCSSKQSIIPKLGIEREVRVCDTCYDEINPNAGKNMESAIKMESESDLPPEYLNSDLAKEAQTKPTLSEDDVKAQEEEELQLAMAISLSEEAVKAPRKNWSLPTANEINKSTSVETNQSAPKGNLFSSVAASLKSVGEDSELNKYLDRSFWEKKNAEIKMRQPSAPAALDAKVTPLTHPEEFSPPVTSQENIEEFNGSDVFIKTMSSSIDLFLDRMNGVHNKGKHIAMDSTVQSLFQSLSAMHPQLMKLIEDEEESKAKFEAMLQKLSVIREARESLNDMRAQYQEKVRQQELEQEMLRRMQMEQKLELMRQQKQEYLEYQRQLQIQRQQELENYQQEKLRQRQTHGMGPDFAGYPEVPTHAPGSHPGAYPQLVGRYGEIPLQNSQLPLKERVASTPQSQIENMGNQYEELDRPPQYPGSSRQYISMDNVDPQVESVVPPSYISIANDGGSSVPVSEYCNQQGELSGNQWQQGTSIGNPDNLQVKSQQQLPYHEPPSVQQQSTQYSMHLKQMQQFPNGQFQQHAITGGHVPIAQQANQELDKTRERNFQEQSYQPQQFNQQLPPTHVQQQSLPHQPLPISQSQQQQGPAVTPLPQSSQQQQLPSAYQQPPSIQTQQQHPSVQLQQQQPVSQQQPPLSNQQLPMPTQLQQHHLQGQQLQQQSQGQQQPQGQQTQQPPQGQHNQQPPRVQHTQQTPQGQHTQQPPQSQHIQQLPQGQHPQQFPQGQDQPQIIKSAQYPNQPPPGQVQYHANDMPNQLPQAQQNSRHHPDPQFGVNQQQQPYQEQQYGVNHPHAVEQVSHAMKDLQLISFD